MGIRSVVSGARYIWHWSDGKRFKGRGLIQLTGRSNYVQYGKYKGRCFLTDETAAQLITDAHLTCDSSGHYWISKQRFKKIKDEKGKEKLIPNRLQSINYWEDKGVDIKDAIQVTKCINSAELHFKEIRWPCFEHALYVLDAEINPPKNLKFILDRQQ
ncbi:hypothetical protein FHW67_003006 [Herbaspirillum sp. Sphag1AN]|uniref:hypothetical protein n=1 Tax=unclassified Herbaspirillum TaxID=2624150 RepID=UPI00160E2A32|nr:MULTISPECIES: hypothetical protein [unclassified Herbaspirillum]MBB3213705.1 hypothetical protein [Herbaspirillum sp. Sphag1AN]MBB3246902.1 hypothetical protein [Herbaspirillum sp. Sphag64]